LRPKHSYRKQQPGQHGSSRDQFCLVHRYHRGEYYKNRCQHRDRSREPSQNHRSRAIGDRRTNSGDIWVLRLDYTDRTAHDCLEATRNGSVHVSQAFAVHHGNELRSLLVLNLGSSPSDHRTLAQRGHSAAFGTCI
jgi:hypothetical protein